MGEIKTKKSKSKIMTAITSSTVRGIIRKANEFQICVDIFNVDD